ncbi:MAG: hypothetical protein WBK55_06825 [Alphaproteobacteria bacterium]
MLSFQSPIKVFVHVAYTGCQSYEVYIGGKPPKTFEVESLKKLGAKIDRGMEGGYGLFNLTQAFEDAFAFIDPHIAESMTEEEIDKYIGRALDYLAGEKEAPSKEAVEKAARDRENLASPPKKEEAFDNRPTPVLSD